MTTIASPLVQSATRVAGEGELQHTGRHSVAEVGMFVVRVIWPIKPRGGSTTPAYTPLLTRSARMVGQRRDTRNHALVLARRLRGYAYRARFRSLPQRTRHTIQLGPSWTVQMRFLRFFVLHDPVRDFRSTRHSDQCTLDSQRDTNSLPGDRWLVILGLG